MVSAFPSLPQLIARGLVCGALMAVACGPSSTTSSGHGATDHAGTPQSPGDKSHAHRAGRDELATPNTPPQLLLPTTHAVGVGQTLTFGLEAVDDEGDEISVSVLEMPKSARYDPLTLTMSWTPTAADVPLARFQVQIAERSHKWNRERRYRHEFAIEVTRARQKINTHARPLGPAVETLITIHDPDRLKAVNQAWPFDRMLEHSANLFIAAMDEAQRGALAKPDRKQMYRTFLKAQADLHGNPRLDPDSPEFDKRALANPNAWKIIAVRPRFDKKWQEVRVVYSASTVPEPWFAMFRLRVVADGKVPDDAQDFNNTEFLRLVAEAFFDGEGNLRPEYYRDKRAHARAVEKFVTSVATYSNPDKAYATATFIALPTAARLGGGSKRDADGAYASGDGWAWSAMKPLPAPSGAEVAYVNIPIKGFWTDVVPSPDNTTWKPACAPRFDPDNGKHVPGWEVLCRAADGLVDLPAVKDGAVASGRLDAVNLYVDHKQQYSTSRLPLRDPRRDLGEEAGMTCSQCHIRSFGIRDRWDASAFDPRAGKPKRMNPDLATTFFIIVPTDRWSPYLIEFQKDQECKGREAFLKYHERETSLTCPIAAPLTEQALAEADEALRARIVAEFERATIAGRDPFLDLFDFDAVGKFEILLRRHDLNGRLPDLTPAAKARLARDTGDPYPPPRERRNLGRLFPPLAKRTVGNGGCTAGAPVSEYSRKLGEKFQPLPPGNERYAPLEREVNEMLEHGGVVGVTCERGEGGLALVYTRQDSPRGYALITLYDDVGANK